MLKVPLHHVIPDGPFLDIGADITPESLEPLLASMRESGQYTEVVIMPHPICAGKFRLLAGLRRYYCAHNLGWSEIGVRWATPEEIEQGGPILVTAGGNWV